MKTLVTVNPFSCRMWPLHDRLESVISEETCRAEIESFAKHGQLVPALGRPLQGDPNHEIELIYGARRLFVARHLNTPLSVELRKMSDREASISMDIENRQRRDISAYERGRSYLRWLRAGLYESQEELGRAISVSKSHVSRLVKVAQLPSAVVGAFESPCDICEGWGLALTDALDDPRRRDQTLRAARALGRSNPRPPAREIYRMLLLASGPGRRVGTKLRDEVVKGSSGAPLFRIKQQRSTVAILLPLEGLSAESMRKIRSALVDVLDSEGSRTQAAQPLASSVDPPRAEYLVGENSGECPSDDSNPLPGVDAASAEGLLRIRPAWRARSRT